MYCVLISKNDPMEIYTSILITLAALADDICSQVCADGALFVQLYKRHARDFSGENKTETN